MTAPESRQHLASAIAGREKDTVRALLENGADIGGGRFSDPMTMAVTVGDPDIIDLLLAHGADVEALSEPMSLGGKIPDGRWEQARMVRDPDGGGVMSDWLCSRLKWIHTHTNKNFKRWPEGHCLMTSPTLTSPGNTDW